MKQRQSASIPPWMLQHVTRGGCGAKKLDVGTVLLHHSVRAVHEADHALCWCRVCRGYSAAALRTTSRLWRSEAYESIVIRVYDPLTADGLTCISLPLRPCALRPAAPPSPLREVGIRTEK